MKKNLLLLASVTALGIFLFLQNPFSQKMERRDQGELVESVVGDKDDPGAAFRFRYGMLAGGQQNVDLLQRRREAINATSQMMAQTNSLRKQSSATSTWSALGPGNIGGRVRSIVMNPSNSSILLAGSVSGGIWKTTDGGTSWKPKSDSLDLLPISAMLVDPVNSNVVYAGTGEGWTNLDAIYGGGIYKSTNFGDSWTLLASTSGASAVNFRNVMKLAADPTGNIYAATKDYNYKYGPGEYSASGGLFKSTNSGTSWTKISSSDFATNYFNPCDVIALSSTVIVFAVGSNGSTLGGIYRTTDGGTSWGKIASNLPTTTYGRIALAPDPNNANTMFAAIESYDRTPAGDAGLKGIYKSTDAGVTWSLLTTPPKIPSTSNMSYFRDQGWYDNVVTVDPANSNNIYLGGVDIMKSTNGGTSWSQLTFWDPFYGSPSIHADHHAIVFDKNNANTLFVGCDGGIYKSTNGGGAWSNLNNGLEITQFYSGAVYKNGATYHGGAQDNGHVKYSGTGTLWTAVFGGDGGYAAQDQTNSSLMYEEYVYLEISKSTNGGSNWTNAVSGLTDANDNTKCLFIAPFAMDPESSPVLAAGSDKVWVTSNSAGTWTQSSNLLSSGANVSAVAVINAASPYLGFAGTTDGKIFRCLSLDPASGVDTWTEITPAGNNGGWVRRVVVDLTNKNKIYATYGAYNTSGTLKSRHVWASTDQGGTWGDISGNLPNVPVHTLAIDPTTSSTLYVGTETGVYSTTNGGSTWSPFNAGMPLYAPTDELVIQNDTKALFAFTHGRGVFSTLPSIASSPGWTLQTSGIATGLLSVKAVSQSVGWTAGNGGIVLMTTNGGTAWNSVGGGTIGSADIYAIDAMDANTAFVTTTPSSTSFIYRTTNAGGTWTQVFNQSAGFVDAIKMIDANNGIAVGDPVGGKWTILKTTDGGASWARIATEPSQVGGEAGWTNSLAINGASNIWFGTSSGKVYRSTDAGVTWGSGTVPFTNCFGLGFAGSQFGVAGSDSGAVARTTNGGVTWTSVSMGGAGTVSGVAGSGNDFFASKAGTVYRSTDKGATWVGSFTGSIGTLNHLSFFTTGSSLSGWTVSDGGNIAAFSGTLTSINVRANSIPTQFVLSQNYPNPFNPQTRIQFSIPGVSHVTLKVFNSVGAEVSTLVDASMPAGVHEVDWNGKDRFNRAVASGVYFYRLVAGDFAETRKMLLVK